MVARAGEAGVLAGAERANLSGVVVYCYVRTVADAAG